MIKLAARAAAGPTTRTAATRSTSCCGSRRCPTSPRGARRSASGGPGWHVECSVMAMANLGPTLDLHGGGTDLIFPHHECEIAQSESVTGEPFSRHWMHSAMVSYEGEKMSKSLGQPRLRQRPAQGRRPPRDPARVDAPPLPRRVRVVRHRPRRGDGAAAPARRRGRAARRAPTRGRSRSGSATRSTTTSTRPGRSRRSTTWPARSCPAATTRPLPRCCASSARSSASTSRAPTTR